MIRDLDYSDMRYMEMFFLGFGWFSSCKQQRHTDHYNFFLA